ncbi:glycosyltransferase family 4 protein [Glutamicibacter sp. AOP5-A2-7]
MKPQVIANAANTIRLITSNILDDPSYFLLQVARKFRHKALVNGIVRVTSHRSAPVLVAAFTATIRDDKAELERIVGLWLSDSSKNQAHAPLANLCIAAGNWQLATKVLERADFGRVSRSRARLEWSLGNMSEAIRALSRIGRSRQLRHYESEFAVYSGLEPSLPDQTIEPSTLDTRRVLYLATNSLPYTGSGYSQRTQSLLRGIQEVGWTVDAATRVNYPINIGNFRALTKDVVAGVEYERFLPFPAKFDFAGRMQQQAEQLLKKVLRDRPGVLHTTTDFSNALAVKAVADATGLPWVYEVRGQLADTWLSTRPAASALSEKYQLFLEREAWAARHADVVLTLGEQMKSNLIAAGVSSEKIEILPNGIGEQFLDCPMPAKIAREQLELRTDAFYIGTVSSLVAYEGLETVLNAVARIPDPQNQLRVLIVGDGTERMNLIRLAENLGISHKCVFPGRVDRIVAHLYFSALDVFVVPRIDSTVTRAVTPLKPVEALASSIPVIASDLPALRELIVDGENGHLVSPADIDAWAACITRLWSDPNHVKKIGRSGREFVLKNRTWNQNAKRLSEVYQQVISKAV